MVVLRLKHAAPTELSLCRRLSTRNIALLTELKTKVGLAQLLPGLVAANSRALVRCLNKHLKQLTLKERSALRARREFILRKRPQNLGRLQTGKDKRQNRSRQDSRHSNRTN